MHIRPYNHFLGVRGSGPHWIGAYVQNPQQQIEQVEFSLMHMRSI